MGHLFFWHALYNKYNTGCPKKGYCKPFRKVNVLFKILTLHTYVMQNRSSYSTWPRLMVVGIAHSLNSCPKMQVQCLPWQLLIMDSYTACCFGYNHGISLVYWTHLVKTPVFYSPVDTHVGVAYNPMRCFG